MEIFTESIIKEKLHEALRKLYVKDYYLIEKSAHERSITHKLAEYLQEQFSNYDVDCEYNLNIDNQTNRKQWINPNNKKELSYLLKEAKENIDKSDDASDIINIIDKLTGFYPDIIVHKRGTNRCNLLVIEAKKNDNVGYTNNLDKEKLIDYTKTNGSSQLQYQLGAFVTFNVGKIFMTNTSDIATTVQYFKNGHPRG